MPVADGSTGHLAQYAASETAPAGLIEFTARPAPLS